MRISNRMMSTLVSANISASVDRQYKLNNQISSGKRIMQASDDPVGTNQALNIRSTLASLEQYGKNVSQAKTQLTTIDRTLSDVNTALLEAKKLAQTGATSTTSDEQRKTLAVQVQQQIDNIVNSLNSQSNGRYQYGGYKTNTAPLVAAASSATNPYNYVGDDGKIVAQVGESANITINLTAKEILNFSGTQDASIPDTLTVLSNLKKAMETGDTNTIQTSMGQLEKLSQNVISLRGQMGARSAQVDLISSRIEETQATLENWKSDVENVDVVQAISDLQEEANVYQAGLIAASRISQQSLADFLR